MSHAETEDLHIAKYKNETAIILHATRKSSLFFGLGKGDMVEELVKSKTSQCLGFLFHIGYKPEFKNAAIHTKRDLILKVKGEKMGEAIVVCFELTRDSHEFCKES